MENLPDLMEYIAKLARMARRRPLMVGGTNLILPYPPPARDQRSRRMDKGWEVLTRLGGRALGETSGTPDECHHREGGETDPAHAPT